MVVSNLNSVFTVINVIQYFNIPIKVVPFGYIVCLRYAGFSFLGERRTVSKTLALDLQERNGQHVIDNLKKLLSISCSHGVSVSFFTPQVKQFPAPLWKI
ncbi:MAG: hypothetical protein D8M57_19490 [Candidatus Scalindua sp. AMX11]|nr:MAG: hypothetical protein DWQ00_06425 [Candidatus Scalindua sp.]TDE63213.1 MAG: hypothetical protein D8M57_19490 [Candidatus Scalindua sp. AMX11]